MRRTTKEPEPARTDSPMRAGLPQREPAMLEHWEQNRLYYKKVENNKGKPCSVPRRPALCQASFIWVRRSTRCSRILSSAIRLWRASAPLMCPA